MINIIEWQDIPEEIKCLAYTYCGEKDMLDVANHMMKAVYLLQKKAWMARGKKIGNINDLSGNYSERDMHKDEDFNKWFENKSK